MTYVTGALIVFGILLAIAVFGYWQSSLAADRLDRDRRLVSGLPQDQTTFRS